MATISARRALLVLFMIKLMTMKLVNSDIMPSPVLSLRTLVEVRLFEHNRANILSRIVLHVKMKKNKVFSQSMKYKPEFLCMYQCKFAY